MKIYGYKGNFIAQYTVDFINQVAEFEGITLDPGSYQAYVVGEYRGFPYRYSAVQAFAKNCGSLELSFTVNLTTAPTIGTTSALPYDDCTITYESLLDELVTVGNGNFSLAYTSASSCGAQCSCVFHIDAAPPDGYSAVSASAPPPATVVSAVEIDYPWGTTGIYSDNIFNMSSGMGYNLGSGKALAAYAPQPLKSRPKSGVAKDPSRALAVPATEVWRSYYYAGAQRVAMRVQDGTQGTDRKYFLLSDHLGSASVVVDANGQPVASRRFYPWGNAFQQRRHADRP